MTKDELFKRIIEGDLFVDIDQSEAVSQFFYSRWEKFCPEHTKPYRVFEAKRLSFEEQLLAMIPEKDHQSAQKIFEDYQEVFYDREHEANSTCYEQGFSEGIKFIFGMLTV